MQNRLPKRPWKVPYRGRERPVKPLASAPGYLEACAKEQQVRDAVYLGVNERIAGFEVLPLLFRQYLFLRFIQSPLLTGGTPQPNDLARFLWMLNPRFAVGQSCRSAFIIALRRWRFMRRCRQTFYPVPKPILRTKLAMILWKRKAEARLADAVVVVEAARAFVSEAMLDCPKPSGASGKDLYSDACAITNRMRRELNCTREAVLNTPMKMLLQELREIKANELGVKAGLRNPSDDCADAWVQSENEKRKQAEKN